MNQEASAALLKRLIQPLAVAPGSEVKLPHTHDPGHTAHFVTREDATAELAAAEELLAEYQERLAAQATHAVVVVLQGIDAAGKDGIIKHVIRGVNPKGLSVHDFGVPSPEERRHDPFWRYVCALPGHGQMAIFNRSHYEEVLVVRVHPELLGSGGSGIEKPSGRLWRRRFKEINQWEAYLYESRIHVVKLFLNLSREEQRRRFLERIDRGEKNWKFSAADVRERRFWDDYQRAFSEMLSHTSTRAAPWYVLPADHKWFTRLCAAAVIVHALKAIDPQYPTLSEEARQELERARQELLAEA